jgi:triacylglycerol lipase
MLDFDNSKEALFNPGHGPYFDGLTLQLVPFEPQRVDYSPRNAWWLAELSRLIYRRSSVENATVLPDRRTILQNAGLAETRFFGSGGTQAALISAATFDVLVFRGTEETPDWLANLKFDFDPWPNGGEVHSGFKHALDVVWNDIAAAVSNVRGPLFITGHSLGAALATLAAARMSGDGASRAVYAYGSPRVGDAEFVKRFPANVHVHRVINDNDAVPTMPPAWLGFRHVGEARCITEDGRLVVGQKSEGIALARKVLKLVQALREKKGLPLPDCLTDHAPVNYVAWMQRLAG